MVNDFEDLISQILKKTSSPEDHYEVVALLESFGWNDDRASAKFGVENLFELGMNLYDAIMRRTIISEISPQKKIGIFENILVVTKSFIRGVIFALPMAISVISMLTLKLSLWSYKNLSTELATCIAIATILSFLTVGGFTQAIARRGYFYISQFYYNMARKMTFYFIRLGYICAFIIVVLFFLLNTFFGFFPLYMMGVTIFYYVLLCAIWLAVTVMYILQKEIVFTGILSMGIAIVYFLFYIIKLDIIVAQVIALLIVSIVGIIFVAFYFKKVEMKMEKGIAAKLPRISITLYSVMPYFIYGFSYFAFLYVDRVLAWSTNDIYMPYAIWFRGAYELGLDFGLLSLMIPMGINEVIINRFVMHLEYNLKNILGSSSKYFNSIYLRMYKRNLRLAVGVSVISALLIYFLVKIFNDNMESWGLEKMITSEITWFVFIWSLVSYAIIAAALLNAVTMFSLSNPDPVNKATILAFLVNAIVGFLCSRWFGYYYAIFGLLAGSIVFMFLSTRYVIKTIEELDYYIYAAS